MFKVYNTVKVKYKNEDKYGYITEIKNNKYKVHIYDVIQEKWYEKNELEIYKPRVYEIETIKRIIRYENLEDFSKPIFVYTIQSKEEKYTITIDDIIIALKNIRNNPKYFKDWIYFIDEEITCGELSEMINLPSDKEIIEGYPTERDILDNIRFDDNILEKSDEIIQRIYDYKENIEKPFYEWKLRKNEKEYFLETWETDEMLNKADEQVVNLIRKYSLELAEDNNEIALRILAYGYYAGNKLFNKDSVKARDYLLRLLPFDKEGYYSNSLGYIYYYGRCNNGVPQYEEAFKCFSIGHCHGIYESTYKLADMFSNGYGVSKDKNVAFRLVSEIYFDNLHYLLDNDISKFPDIALRMGNFKMDIEVNGYEDYDMAYYYYLQANYAIGLRRKEINYVGDDKVFNAIKKCLEETYPKTSYYKQKTIFSHQLYDVIGANLRCGERILAKINVKGEKANLILRNVEKNRKLFITIPQLNFSGEVEKLNIKLKGYSGHHIFEGEKNTFIFNGQESNRFYFHGTKVAQISLDSWGISKKIITKDKEYKIASCWFTTNGKKYDYLCNNDYSIGDKVTVNTPDGEAEVEIVNISMKKESELFLPINKYKSI